MRHLTKRQATLLRQVRGWEDSVDGVTAFDVAATGNSGTEGAVYAALRRLDRRGLIASTARKDGANIWRLTPHGREVLDQLDKEGRR